MTLYEIDQEILNCVDEETGEIIDLDKLQALRIAKDRKIESIGLWYKNLNSDVQALELEIKMLTERKNKAKNKMEQLRRKTERRAAQNLSFMCASDKNVTKK